MYSDSANQSNIFKEPKSVILRFYKYKKQKKVKKLKIFVSKTKKKRVLIDFN